jgi:hypothetical protein
VWVRVPRLPLDSRPGTPSGRAGRLKPGRLGVRIPPRANRNARLRGVARSTRLVVSEEIGGSNPPGGAGCRARRTVRQSAERPSSNLGDLWVRLPPVRLARIDRRVGWALASPSGCNPPARGLCRFDSCPTHWHASPVGPSAGTPVPHTGEAGSTPARATEKASRRVVEQETRSAQDAVPLRGREGAIPSSATLVMDVPQAMGPSRRLS